MKLGRDKATHPRARHELHGIRENETKAETRFIWFHASMIKKNKKRKTNKQNQTLNTGSREFSSLGVSFGTRCQLLAPPLCPSLCALGKGFCDNRQ